MFFRAFPPCLPTSAKIPPTGTSWVYEIKHDGFRLIARRVGGDVRLFSGLRTFKLSPVLLRHRMPAGGLHSIFNPRIARSFMRIQSELFVAVAAVVALCLAWPAEAAKKKKRSSAPVGYSTNYAAGPGTWGYGGTGPIYNGQDYIGQDPDPNIRAYILKDLGIRYGGAF